MIEQLAERVKDAAARAQPLRIRSGGTKDFYGQALQGDVLDMRDYRGIVAYEPTELYVTARCGTPLADLEAALAEKRQMLAFEPPHFGPEASIGGCVAAGLSGPRRMSAGAVRDFMLGVKLMDGNGAVLNFGGTVMKNVAGYDVSRLMAGALGTLGVLLEVSLKVLPQPTEELTLHLEMPPDKALEAMNAWAGRPLPISATAYSAGELGLRLSGAAAAVAAARDTLGGELVDGNQAAQFWRGMREHTDDFFTGADTLWRLAVASTAPPLTLPGAEMIEWGGALRWWKSAAEPSVVRAAATAAGGHATLFRGEKQAAVFAPLPEALMRIHRGLKQAFDPAGILNRGRMYDGF